MATGVADRVWRMEELMPVFWVVYTPPVEMQHQLGADYIKKLIEGAADMSAPLPEAATLAMPDDEGIHEEHHVPMTTDRFVVPHLILIEAKIIFTTQVELVHRIPETPAMQDRWHITECIIAHQHIYVPHVLLFGCGFDDQHSTLTRQILNLQTDVGDIHDIHCAFSTIGFGIFGFREGITFQGGHDILHGMLFSVLLSRQTEVNMTIRIQSGYIQKLPDLNAFDEVWAVAIPSIYQQMREADILLLEFIKEFQTQLQLGFEYIQLLAIGIVKCVLFLDPLLGKVRTMVYGPILSGIHIVAGYYYLSPVYLAKRTYPLSASSMSRISRLGIPCIINDYIAIFTASCGSIVLQNSYPPVIERYFIPWGITHKVMHGLVIGINDMLTDVPDILPFYLQEQSSTIESEVSPLGLFPEYVLEFLVEALEHGMANGCKEIHHNLLYTEHMLLALLYLLLHPFSHVILTKQS
jgi:hypothetical protein